MTDEHAALRAGSAARCVGCQQPAVRLFDTDPLCQRCWLAVAFAYWAGRVFGKGGTSYLTLN